MGEGRFLIRDAVVLDTVAGALIEGQAVLVDGDRIAEVGPTATVRAGEATVLDAAGMTVLPGLIDAHVHVTAATANLSDLEHWSPAYLTARSAEILRGMLGRGFTTVRDVAGADFGLAAAVAEDLLPGPRLVFGGKALSQTGGHAIPGHREGPCSTSIRAARARRSWPTALRRSAAPRASSSGAARTTSR